MSIRDLGRYAWRKYVTDGVPASGFNSPDLGSGSDIYAFVDAVGAAVTGATIRDVTSSRALTDDDAGCVLAVDAGGPVTLTLPAGLAIGFSAAIVQVGVGQVSIMTSGGAALRHPDAYSGTRTQYSAIVLAGIATDEYVLTGDAA